MRGVTKQRGMSATGFLIIAVVAGFFLLCFFKLFPIYSEYLVVKGVVDSLPEEMSSPSVSKSDIRNAIDRRFQVETPKFVTIEDIDIEEVADGFNLVLDYEVREELMFNLDIVAKFYHEVDIDK